MRKVTSIHFGGWSILPRVHGSHSKQCSLRSSPTLRCFESDLEESPSNLCFVRHGNVRCANATIPCRQDKEIDLNKVPITVSRNKFDGQRHLSLIHISEPTRPY